MQERPPSESGEPASWRLGVPEPPAEPGVVQLWAWSLAWQASQASDSLQVCLSPGAALSPDAVLSEDEVARADRFHFPEHRRRFLLAHVGLRALLAGATGVPPEEIAFEYAEFGKPRLAGETNVRFNLSHTGDIALAAITLNDEVGVDIEAHRPCEQAEAIAQRHFSTGEAANYRGTPASAQAQLFFDLWTAKEAVIKLLGSGLRFPLTSFETPGAHAGAGEIALPQNNPLAIQRCWLHRIEGFTGCSAAVACVSQPKQIVARRLDLSTT